MIDKKHEFHHIIYRINHEVFYNVIQELTLRKSKRAIACWNAWIIDIEIWDIFEQEEENPFFLDLKNKK
jgi:hypothetical protein